MSTQQHVSEIESSLRAFSNPERAPQEKRYLKSDLDHLGASVWEIRRAVKEFARAHPDLERQAILDLVCELWSVPLHERRMSAVMLLELKVEKLAAEDLGVVEQLIRESHGWAFVDGLAGDVAGPLILRHPTAVARVDGWAIDSDFWLRRSALLSCLAPHKEGWPLDRFFGYADSMLAEKEFFVRKAIGWVLREAGKNTPDEVFAWLRPRLSRVSGVTLREAVKYLSQGQRDELVAGYKHLSSETSRLGLLRSN